MPVIICLKVPGRNVFTSTLLMQTVCWKLLFEGSHEMIDEECVTADALTHEGPSGAPRPIIIVQAASFDVFLLTNTERTLIRCGCKKKEMRMHRSPPSPHLDVNPTNALPLLSCHPQRLSISLSKDIGHPNVCRISRGRPPVSRKLTVCAGAISTMI